MMAKLSRWTARVHDRSMCLVVGARQRLHVAFEASDEHHCHAGRLPDADGESQRRSAVLRPKCASYMTSRTPLSGGPVMSGIIFARWPVATMFCAMFV